MIIGIEESEIGIKIDIDGWRDRDRKERDRVW